MTDSFKQNIPVQRSDLNRQDEPLPPKLNQSAPPPWMTGVQETKTEPPPAENTPSPVKASIFKKLIPVLGIVILALALFLLISKVIWPALNKMRQGSKTSETEVTLTYWGLWEPENVISPLISEYKKTHPKVTINYSRQSYKDYRERLQSALARGDGPDIFRFHNSWLPMLKKDLSPMPQDISQSLDLDANFFPQVSKDLKLAGQVFGVALGFDTLVLYYNTNIFKSAGIKPPTNWEDLRRAALDLTVRGSGGQIQVAGVALGTANNIDNFSDILGLMMLQNGADLAKPTDSLAGDALRFYTLFYTNDRVWDKNLPNSTYAFAKEQVAMIFAPSWRAHEIKSLNPNIEFKTLPVPQLPETKVAWATYWVEGVSAKSQNAKEAWEFLQYLSSKEALTQFYSNASQIRAFGEPYPRIDLAQELLEDEVVGSVAKQASYAQSWYMCSFTHDNGINDKIIKYFEDAVNSVLQGSSIEAALATASQGVTQILSQYGI